MSAVAWVFSSAGRASALQAEGRRFEPVNTHHFFIKLYGRVAKWPNAVDCKSIPEGSAVQIRPLPPL